MMGIPVIYPMGAKTDKKRQELAWDNPNYICERKYDGSRYLARVENGEVRFVSRQQSKKTGLPVDKTENVPHLVEMLGDFPNGTVLDGEIITHENCTSNEVTSIMGALPEKAISRQEENGWVQYVVFDVLYYDGTDFTGQPYELRRKALENILSRLTNFSDSELGNYSDYIYPAPIEKVNKKEYHMDIIQGGGEGTILKNIHKPYIADKKPIDTWIKVKTYDTYDVVIMGYTSPTKEYTGKDPENWQYHDGDMLVTKDYAMGWIGAVEYGQYKDGKLVRIGQTDGIADDVKEYITKNKEALLGTVMEVGAMRQNEDTGALVHPRFLRFRDDKSPEQCILGEI